MKDVFEVQDEIASKIAQALRITLSPQEQEAIAAKPTDNLQAYDLYLRGKSYARRLQRQDLEFALQMFENAVILDPNFALAYAAIANVCAQNHYNYGRDPVWMERAMKASETAVVLRPDLPEVQVAQAWILYANGKYDEAVAVVQKAIDRKRDCEGAYYILGRTLFASGRYQEVANIADAAFEASGEDYNIYVPIVNSLGALGKQEAQRNVRQRFATAPGTALKQGGRGERLTSPPFSLTDRRDAAHLLTLLVENRFPRIWVPTPAERDLRQLLWHRHKVVGMRTALRNQLHALARSQGLCRGRQLWSQHGRQQLAALKLDGWASQRHQDLLSWLQLLDARVAELDQQVRVEVEQRPDAVRLMTHPGVGAIVALTFVLTLGRVERFRCSKQVVSYLGLNPREFSSGGRQRLGAISKQGNTLLRWLLVEAAQTAARHDPELERDYRHLVFRRGRGVAKVAVARKLAVRLYWMWREKRTYAELIRRPSVPMPGSPQLVVVDSRPSVF